MIPIILAARLQSERCKRKTVRPFHNGLSLTEISLEKFKGRKDVYLMAREEIFEEMAKSHNIPFLKRTEQSVMGETLSDIYAFLKDTHFTDILSYNVCCPFTKPETIDTCIKIYQERKLQALKCAVEMHEIILDDQMLPLNRDANEPNSKYRKPLYTVANNFYIFNFKRFWEIGGKLYPSYQKDDPYFHPIDYTEALDIDTEDQFRVVQAIYQNMHE
jgi:CMP-N-acetylneuraminic acid synthetase